MRFSSDSESRARPKRRCHLQSTHCAPLRSLAPLAAELLALALPRALGRALVHAVGELSHPGELQLKHLVLHLVVHLEINILKIIFDKSFISLEYLYIQGFNSQDLFPTNPEQYRVHEDSVKNNVCKISIIGETQQFISCRKNIIIYFR